MKKLIGLCLIVSQFLVASEGLSNALCYEQLVDQALDHITADIVMLAQSQFYANERLLIEEYCCQAPQDIAQKRLGELELLARQYQCREIDFDTFENKSYDIFTQIPKVVEYNGTQCVAYLRPTAEGMRYELINLKREEEQSNESRQGVS